MDRLSQPNTYRRTEMSTELVQKLNKLRDIGPEMTAEGYEALLCECIALAFLPQQDVGAGRDVPSPVGQEPTVEQVLDIVSEAYGDMTHRRAGGVNIEALRARLSALFTHPPKAGVMTDEEAAHCAMLNYGAPKGGWSDPLDPLDPPVVFALGMRYARDNGYLSPKP